MEVGRARATEKRGEYLGLANTRTNGQLWQVFFPVYSGRTAPLNPSAGGRLCERRKSTNKRKKGMPLCELGRSVAPMSIVNFVFRYCCYFSVQKLALKKR